MCSSDLPVGEPAVLHNRLPACFLKSTDLSPLVSQKSTSVRVLLTGGGTGSVVPEPFLQQLKEASERQIRLVVTISLIKTRYNELRYNISLSNKRTCRVETQQGYTSALRESVFLDTPQLNVVY